MGLESSPVVYSASSSPVQPKSLLTKKRKNASVEPAAKKQKTFGNELAQSRDVAKAESIVAATSKAANDTENQENWAPTRTQPGVDARIDGDDDVPIEYDLALPSDLTGLRQSAVDDAPSTVCSPAIYDSLPEMVACRTAGGKRHHVRKLRASQRLTDEQLIARRSTVAPDRAQKAYYGVDIHALIDDAKLSLNERRSRPRNGQAQVRCVPSVEGSEKARKKGCLMWTEKYRARKFTDLVGDERTHRMVLRWLKAWDEVVFPGVARPKAKAKDQTDAEERRHRKILLLTGSPGLGKTTLAHVCARQAGYEAVEINASDERSRDVVRGRIRDCVGTENVRGINERDGDSTVRKAGRPVCVIVDEVDGAVAGSGGSGDGGFMKALVDLILLDQKNCKAAPSAMVTRKGPKGDRFRLLRPMILICNDVYHPSLRPLRFSGLAEIIHLRKPPLDKVISRLKTVFDREGVPSDTDAVRRLCEATWGVTSLREGRSSGSSAEGDIRSVLVVGEWVASRLRASNNDPCAATRLTRQWVESHLCASLASGGASSRAFGRGTSKEAADRVFLEGAGFPKAPATALASNQQTYAETINPSVNNSVNDQAKQRALNLLREVVDTTGEHDRIVTDIFTAYPSEPFQDDIFLSKPNSALSDWLHFHDVLSQKVHNEHEWELMPYLSQSILAFHHLFASPARSHGWSNEGQASSKSNVQNESLDEETDTSPFVGPRADFTAYETLKSNKSTLQSIQASFSPHLSRAFRSPEEIATDLIPNLARMLNPNIKPVIVGGSGEQRSMASVRREVEKEKVRRAVEAMSAVGVEFERVRIEDQRSVLGRGASHIYRMEPPIDVLSTFDTLGTVTSTHSTSSRYAVRQVLDQEHQKYKVETSQKARAARFDSGASPADSASNPLTKPGQVARDSTTAPSSGKPDLLAISKKPRRDFFGRIVPESADGGAGSGKERGTSDADRKNGDVGRIWVSFHEGFSNAVRKPVTVREFLAGL